MKIHLINIYCLQNVNSHDTKTLDGQKDESKARSTKDFIAFKR